MQIRPPLIHTTARQLPVGHLAQVWNGNGRSLLLRFSNDPRPIQHFMFIPLAGGEGPSARPQGPGWNPDVLSYGSEWVLRYELDEASRPGQRDRYDTPGVLYLGESGPLLSCRDASEQGFRDDILFMNLETTEFVDLPGQAWPTERWSIWLSTELTGLQTETPLYKHQAPVQAAGA